MKGFLLPGLMFALVTLVNVIIPIRGAPGALPLAVSGSSVAFGAYDPDGQLADEPDVAIDHVFIDWNMPPERTRTALRMAEARQRDLMVTLEPFPRPGQVPSRFAADMLKGDYDRLLKAHCQALSEARARIFMRFAHEMDLDNGRYAWSGLPPETYIALYRGAVHSCRRSFPHVVAVWSPVGHDHLTRYYPGDDTVDMVGLSLFGLEPWEEIAFGQSRSFAEALEEKYRRIAGFGKPLTIAEFGVCGTPLYRARWLTDALGGMHGQFPLLQSIIYFNDREPFRWPAAGQRQPRSGCDIEHPDWRLPR